ncbi:MAG: hypothetical protein Q4F18_11750 [Clostridia bacterium]|nr:hypothetical protein [Clostridia bacterium]
MLIMTKATYKRAEKRGGEAVMTDCVMREIPDDVVERFAVKDMAIRSRGHEKEIYAAYAALLADRRRKQE